MLAAAIIVFREVIEAGLVVGIVLAATRGVRSRGWYVAGGICAGLVGAALLATFMGSISSALEGVGQEIFNATILGIAVVMLAWHNVWMAKHGRVLAAESVAAGQAVATGSKTLMALSIVVGVAVLREGSEAVLILYGNFITTADGGWSTFLGSLLGLAGGVMLSITMFLGLVLIPSRYIFTVTNYLIAFLAAGMASQCVHLLDQADIVSALSSTAWDTSWFLSSSSIAGRVFHTLLGYDDRPSVMQVIVYLATLITILAAMRIFAPGKPKPKPKLQETPAPAKPGVVA